MTWYVKWRKPDLASIAILCDEAAKAAELYDEQKALGSDVWIEDHEGRPVDRSDLHSA